MEDMWKKSSTPKGILKVYKDLETRLASLSSVANNTEVDSQQLQQAMADYRALSKDVHKLSIEFELLSTEQKKALLGDEVLSNFKKRAEAIDAYNKLLTKNIELNEKKTKLETEKSDHKKKKEDADSKVAQAKETKSGLIEPKISKAAEQYLKDQQELKEVQEQIIQNQKVLNKLAQEGRQGGKTYASSSQNLETLKAKETKLKKSTSTGKGKSEYESYAEQIRVYKETLEDCNKTIDEQSKVSEKAADAISTIDDQIGKLNIKDEAEAFTKLKDRLKELGVEGIDGADSVEVLSDKLKELESQAISGVDSGIKEIRTELDNLGETAKQTGEKLDLANRSLRDQEEAAQKRKDIENKIKQFLGLAGAAQVLRHAVKDAMKTITELDATMTEMAVVTDLTVGDYWDQLPEYSKRASELGVSINSAYKAATLYYQQGLKTNEVNAISVETLKMAKIANMDAAEATDKMTAALRGFNMELNEASAKRISDVYSELAAITAADTQEIANAMTKTASIASSAGMEFETTAAFLAQIVETTRESAETAGTAMKTVIARFQELKKDPSEIGEVDGEIVDANAIETALRSVGVSLRESNGQFRELDDVFLELSSKWNTLDKNTQRYIATIAAGSRQQSRFIAMMQDYSRTQELVTAANNSAGASQKQFEKTMDSLEAKVEKLKNAWHEFTMGIMNSEFVKAGIDILTKFLEIVNNATSSLTGLGGSISKILSILTIFKLGSKIFDKLKTPLYNFFAEIIKQAGFAGEQAGNAAQEGLAKSKKGATGQGATPETYGQNGEPKQPSEKKDLLAGVKSGWSNIKQNVKKVDDARKGLAEKKGLEKQAQQSYQQEELSASTTVSLLKSENAQKKAKKAQLEGQLGSLEQEQETRKAGIGKAKSGGRKKQKSAGLLETNLKVTQKKIKETKDELQGVNDEIAANEKAMADSIGAVEEKQKAYLKTQQDTKEAQGALFSAAKEGFSNIGKSLMDSSEAVTSFGVGLSMAGGLLSSLGFEEAGEAISGIGQAITLVGGALSALPAIIGVIQTVLASPPLGIILLILGAVLAMILIITSIMNKNSAAKSLEKASEAADQAAEAAEEASEAYKNLADSLNSLEDKYKALEDLTKGTEEWNEAIKDINSSVLDLIQEYPELAKFVKNEGGVLTIDVDSSEVQSVLNDYQQKAVIASNVAVGAKIEVENKKVDYEKEKLQDTSMSSFGYGNEMAANYGEALSKGIIAKTTDGSFEIIEGQEAFAEELGITETTLSSFRYFLEEDEEALREYGNSLIQAEEQTKALYEAMALQAQQLVDMSNWSEQQRNQASNLVSGEDIQRYQEEVAKTYEDTNSEKTNQALEQYMMSLQGVSSVKDIGKNDITYVDSEGKEQTVDKETYLKQMISAEATNKAASAIQATKTVTSSTADQVGKKLAGQNVSQEAITNAVGRLFEDSDGGKLTKADTDVLSKLTQEELKQIYESTDELQDLFASAEEFANSVQDTIRKSEETAADAKAIADKINEGQDKKIDIVKDFMDAGQQQAFAKKMNEVFQKTGADGASTIVDNFDKVLQGKTEEEKQRITDAINSYDWSNIEEVRKMQLELANSFDVGTVEANQFAEAIIQYNQALSSFATTINPFDSYATSLSELEAIERKLTDLQWEYNQALRDSERAITGVIGSLIEQIVAVNQTKFEEAVEARRGAAARLSTAYASGASIDNMDLTQLVKLTQNEDGVISLDTSALENNMTLANNENVQKWIESVNEQISAIASAEDTAREAKESILDLEDTTKESKQELRDAIKETILNGLEEQIDVSRQILDTTKEANAQLISKIQEQINEQRQRDENQKTEQSIEDMYSKLAYLSMDTGGNQLETAQLGEQIQNAEEDYKNTLIDQSIQQLQDANARAEEQRDRQISLQEQALESYKNSEMFQADVENALQEMLSSENPFNTAIGEQMRDGAKLGLSEEELDDWQASMAVTIAEAKGITNLDEVLAGMDMSNLSLEAITTKATELAETQQRSELSNKGFNLLSAKDANGSFKHGTDVVTAAENLIKKDSATENAEHTATLKRAKDAGMYSKNVLSEKDYYNSLTADQIKNGAKSYTEYLASEVSGVGKFENLTAAEAFGGISVPGSYSGMLDMWGNPQFVTDEYFDATVNGETDNYVRLGDKVSDDSLIKRLDHIYNNTGSSNTPYTYYNDMLYLRQGAGTWWIVKNESDEDYPRRLRDSAKNYMDSKTDKKYTKYAYKTGGLADFTGPAWLDGTPSKPEYILNPTQTERFFSLVDVLESFDKNSKESKPIGDNYFDISINVEKLENDYDVEKIANKIRSMIYEDASYRNVNAISYIR